MDDLPPPDAGTGLTCSTCSGWGSVIRPDLTGALRRAGHPVTVLGQCPACAPLALVDVISNR